MSDTKLDWLFLDMNSYFASVEQHLRPELRGRPVVVVPVMAETTCCIAASYEAKRYGVKTGTAVAAARRLCPELHIVESRPMEYINCHHKIVNAVESVLPVDKVHSIDEMSCSLMGRQRELDNAVGIAGDVKRAIKEQVGEFLLCSIGLATNRFLAKVASGMKKPDGFTVIPKEELPQKLYPLSLRDLPGIGRNMHLRLKKHNVQTVRDLCALSEIQCTNIWSSVVGTRWWHMLRGEDVYEPETTRRSVGHSHVLAPQYRTEEGTRAVFIRLIHKAAFRLRRIKYLTNQMNIGVDYFNTEKKWKWKIKIDNRNDTNTMINMFAGAWEDMPKDLTPLRLSVSFTGLRPENEVSVSLFSNDTKRDKVSLVLDKINEKYGNNSIYYGSLHDAPDSAPLRISFTSIPDVVAESSKADHERSGD